MDRKDIKESYDKIVHEYGEKFCRKLQHRYTPDGWVGGKVGGVYELCDCFFNLHDITYFVDNDVSTDDFMKWYYYCTDLAHISDTLKKPDLRQWMEGCCRLTEEQISRLHQAKNELERLVDEAARQIREGGDYARF